MADDLSHRELSSSWRFYVQNPCENSLNHHRGTLALVARAAGLFVRHQRNVRRHDRQPCNLAIRCKVTWFWFRRWQTSGVRVCTRCRTDGTAETGGRSYVRSSVDVSTCDSLPSHLVTFISSVVHSSISHSFMFNFSYCQRRRRRCSWCSKLHPCCLLYCRVACYCTPALVIAAGRCLRRASGTAASCGHFHQGETAERCDFDFAVGLPHSSCRSTSGACAELTGWGGSVESFGE